MQEEVLNLGLKIFPLHGKKPPKGCHWPEEAVCAPVSTPSYGIPCEDKLAVIDCDTRERAVWWFQNRERTPWMVKTPRGGVHFFYAGETRNAQKIEGAIDIRGNGGYVVGVGSRIRQNFYELVKGCKITLDLPSFDPSWTGKAETVVEREAEHGDISLLRRRARLFIARIFSVSGEGGDKALFRAACALCQRFELGEREALEELLVWNATNAKPPWGERRLRYKIAEALKLRK